MTKNFIHCFYTSIFRMNLKFYLRKVFLEGGKEKSVNMCLDVRIWSIGIFVGFKWSCMRFLGWHRFFRKTLKILQNENFFQNILMKNLPLKLMQPKFFSVFLSQKKTNKESFNCTLNFIVIIKFFQFSRCFPPE